MHHLLLDTALVAVSNIGGDGLHANDDLVPGAAGVFFLDVEPAQRVQHHQAAALGGALEAVEGDGEEQIAAFAENLRKVI